MLGQSVEPSLASHLLAHFLQMIFTCDNDHENKIRDTVTDMSHSEVERVFRDHGDELQRYLIQRVSCTQIAKDIAQEAFIRLSKEFVRSEIRQPKAYLYRIARNLVIDHFRRISREPIAQCAELPETIPDPAPDPERYVMAKDELNKLHAAILDLPSRQRDILLMHRFDGLSYDEIAGRLGISRNTVMVHMMRAVSRCREKMTE